MTIQYLDSRKQPIADAVVSIAEAPGQMRDIAMVTDENGVISVDVEEQGSYVFSVFHEGKAHQVAVALRPQDTEVSVVVTG